MKKYMMLIIFWLVLVMIGLNRTGASEKSYQILYLDSYHDGYVWSDDVRRGIREVLSSNYSNYTLRIEHMDTKYILTDSYKMALVGLLKEKYDPNDFDVIISSDDNALDFLLEFKDVIFPDTPVFFCGVNHFDLGRISKKTDYYGIEEKVSFVETLEVALRLAPQAEDLYIILDNSLTGQGIRRGIDEDFKDLNLDMTLHHLSHLSFEEITSVVKDLNPDKSILFYVLYVIDADGHVMDLDQGAKELVKVSPVPVHGLYSFGFDKSLLGGKFINGYSQGKAVTRLAVDYLNGSPPQSQLISSEKANEFYYDYEIMKKFQIDESLLPHESIIINKPKSFYEKHKVVINISLIIVALLVIYLVVLRIQVAHKGKKIKEKERELMESNKLASLGRIVSNVAHELNTPLGTGITVSSHIRKTTDDSRRALLSNTLSKGRLVAYFDAMDQHLSLVDQSLDQAARLVKNFKEIASGSQGESKTVVQVSDLIKSVVDQVQHEFPQKTLDLTLTGHLGLRIVTYLPALHQVSMQIVTNAVVHTGSAGNIVHLEVSIEARKNHLLLTFKDDGPGMTDENLVHIFEPFYSTERKQGHFGLGLHIAYNLVTQVLAGTIECQSVQGQGTDFLVKLPLTDDHHKRSSTHME